MLSRRSQHKDIFFNKQKNILKAPSKGAHQSVREAKRQRPMRRKKKDQTLSSLAA